MKRPGFKMSGMSFKEDQTPMKKLKAGGSKEELLQIAEQFTSTPEPIDIDYGGGFDASFTVDPGKGGSGKPKKGEKEKDKDKKKGKRKWWQKKKKAIITADMDYLRKSAIGEYGKFSGKAEVRRIKRKKKKTT